MAFINQTSIYIVTVARFSDDPQSQQPTNKPKCRHRDWPTTNSAGTNKRIAHTMSGVSFQLIHYSLKATFASMHTQDTPFSGEFRLAKVGMADLNGWGRQLVLPFSWKSNGYPTDTR